MTREARQLQRITLSAYSVEFIDLREPKPRTIYTEHPVFNEKMLATLDEMGVDRTVYIEERYTRDGYKVISPVKKLPKRTAYVDLSTLYRQAEADAAAEDQARRVADLEELAADQARQLEALAQDQAAEQGAQQV